MYSLYPLAVCAFFSALITGCGILEPGEPVAALSTTDQPVSAAEEKQTVQAPVVDRASKSSVSSNIDASIVQIFQTNRCGDLSRGGFIWFTNEVTLDDWLKPLSPDLAQQIKSQVNFNTQGVLLVDYGLEASPGGGTEIADKQLRVESSEAFVVLKKLELDKSKKRVQMVTHPCTMYVMPRTGYDFLSVRNELGEQLIMFENLQ